MKRLVLFISLLIGICVNAQVPNTNTFSFTDVQTVMQAQQSGAFNDLQECVNAAITNHSPISDDDVNRWIERYPNSLLGFRAYEANPAFDGKYMIFGAREYNGIYSTNNYGISWDSYGIPDDMGGVAISLDGKYRLGAAYGGYLYVSADYGSSYNSYNTPQSWVGAAMSNTGKYMIACHTGYLQVSSNYGVSWVAASTANNSAVSMSGSGQYQAAATGGYVAVSADYGVTWASKGYNVGYYSVAVSGDGKYMIAGSSSQYIYMSSDYGVTWAKANAITSDWVSVALSETGKYQYAISGTLGIYRSTDYGITWTLKESTAGRKGIAVSGTGKYVIYGNSLSEAYTWIYKSSNYGVSFTAILMGGYKRYDTFFMSRGLLLE